MRPDRKPKTTNPMTPEQEAAWTKAFNARRIAETRKTYDETLEFMAGQLTDFGKDLVKQYSIERLSGDSTVTPVTLASFAINHLMHVLPNLHVENLTTAAADIEKAERIAAQAEGR